MTPSFRQALITLAAACALSASGAAAWAADRVLPDAQGLDGRWLTATGALEVDLGPCGPAWCGTVARVLSSRRMSAEAVAEGPAASLLGLKILHGLTPSGPNEWQGKIYNRDDGQTYDCLVSLRSPDQLDVRGYRFLPLFGKTSTWRRVPARVLP